MDDLARGLGVRPLMDFFSMSHEDVESAAENFEIPVEDMVSSSGPEQWFDPDAGLGTVRALAKHLAANPKAVKNTSAVLEDLRQFEQVLLKTREKGLQWHLAVDY